MAWVRAPSKVTVFFSEKGKTRFRAMIPFDVDRRQTLEGSSRDARRTISFFRRSYWYIRSLVLSCTCNIS